MPDLTEEQVRFFKSVDIATGCLELALAVAMRRNLFGKPKPTDSQLAYCYGFSEELADLNLGTDNMERSIFVRLVFNNLFGEQLGSKLANGVVEREMEFPNSLRRGNEHAQGFVDGRVRVFQAPWHDITD